VNSPARVSRRTARPRSAPLVLPGHPGFLRRTSTLSGRAVISRPISGSFHPPSGVLFSFPSRYLVRYRSRDVFSLGGWCPQVPTAEPSRGTLVARLVPLWFSLRGCHPLRRGFPAHFGYHRTGPSSTSNLNTTFPSGYPVGVWFGLLPFRSPLLRESLVVSLPPPTKMFPFGGFPSGTPRKYPVSRIPRGESP